MHRILQMATIHLIVDRTAVTTATDTRYEGVGTLYDSSSGTE